MKLSSILFALSIFAATPAATQDAENQISYVSNEIVQEVPDEPETTEPVLDVTEQQLDCLARVMHHEARGEGRQGQLAVGYVVVNRMMDKRFPSTICRVTTQPYQFTNFRLGKRIKNYDYFYSLAQEIVSDYNMQSDPTSGALFFHATYVKPSWHRTKQRTARIKAHIFYK